MTNNFFKHIIMLLTIFTSLIGNHMGCIRNEHPADMEVLDLYKKISIGMSSCDIALIFCVGNYNYLNIRHYELSNNDDKKQFRVNTPTRIGAANWVLYITFQNDKVESIKIRTADSKEIRPINAPLDKGGLQGQTTDFGGD